MEEEARTMGEEENLFLQLNRVKDEKNKTPTEMKHTAVIEAPEKVKKGAVFEVRVSVGETEHPMENAHFIQWVELLADGLFISRAEFTPVVTKPSASFRVVLTRPARLQAKIRCNMHGLWISEKALEVE